MYMTTLSYFLHHVYPTPYYDTPLRHPTLNLDIVQSPLCWSASHPVECPGQVASAISISYCGIFLLQK